VDVGSLLLTLSVPVEVYENVRETPSRTAENPGGAAVVSNRSMRTLVLNGRLPCTPPKISFEHSN
jgi:hypothetical protein